MKKSLVTLLLVLAIGALVQQAAAQGAAPSGQAAPAQKQIKDPAEYNAYVNAIQQTTPAAKAQALEAFPRRIPTVS